MMQIYVVRTRSLKSKSISMSINVDAFEVNATEG